MRIGIHQWQEHIDQARAELRRYCGKPPGWSVCFGVNGATRLHAWCQGVENACPRWESISTTHLHSLPGAVPAWHARLQKACFVPSPGHLHRRQLRMGRRMTKQSIPCIAFGLACLMVMPMANGQESRSPDCHPLLMAAECDRFHERMAKAADDSARVAFTTELQRLIAERERLCPCHDEQRGCWRSGATATRISSHARLF